MLIGAAQKGVHGMAIGIHSATPVPPPKKKTAVSGKGPKTSAARTDSLGVKIFRLSGASKFESQSHTPKPCNPKRVTHMSTGRDLTLLVLDFL